MIDENIILQGADPGGLGPGGQAPPQKKKKNKKKKKRGKPSHACERMQRVLVGLYLTVSRTPPPPVSEILYPPLIPQVVILSMLENRK